MGVFLKLFICMYFFAVTQSEERPSWLACKFIDEHVFVNKDNHSEVELQPRHAMLQFGQAGDPPVNPHTITFMVTASKLDLQSYMVGGSSDDLECEIRRYSMGGIQVRWPSQGAQAYDLWFTCTVKHPEDSFTFTGYLRHTPKQPPSGMEDYQSVPPIGDREIIATSASMVLHTRSVALKVGLRSEQKLHCQFAVDHRGPNFRVEWRAQRHGDWAELFSHTSHSGETWGSGVSRTGLVKTGDATLTIPFIKISSEGKYVCSVSIGPLRASLDVLLHVFEPPSVSLNVGPELELEEGAEQKVVCEAAGYYPLDVDIEWYQEPPGEAAGYRAGAPLPRKLQNVLLSSHKHNKEGTYSLLSFFYYTASLKDSGGRFSCRVMHGSLRTPIRKGFTLLIHARQEARKTIELEANCRIGPQAFFSQLLH
ncbi:Tapasin-related protein [Merluccius polli]|uniref:Tapasin-related protein n=1 Tax=Merluccius polli TaxID=89951 RepID=A0AA47MJD1_MERPO|nr:Tapasin-related protein [Merluccius polli]